MKTCTKCHQDKSLVDFYKRDANRWMSQCKECLRAGRAFWREANRVKERARHCAYRRAHTGQSYGGSPEYMRTWRAAHPNYFRERAAAHPEKLREWKAANPTRLRQYKQTRRARKRRAFKEHVSLEEVIRRDKNRCGICGTIVAIGMESLDHVLPLSRGGEHSYRNVQLAHKRCNSSKGDRIIGQQFRLTA